MCRTMLFILIITWLSTTTISVQGHQAKESEVKARAQKLLSQAREALGGEAKLEAVKSFSASGKYRRVSQFQGQSSISEGELGFDFLLPDKFLKTETRSAPSGDKITRLRGLNGDHYFQDSISSNPAAVTQGIPAGGNTPDPKDELRAEGARYLLAWLLTSSSSLPIELSYVGEAKTKEGAADVLAAKGPHGFAARLCLDQQTHRLVMLSYRGRAQRTITMTGGGGPVNLSDAIKEAERQLSKEEEIELQFSEYRAIDGVLLPHRIKQRVSGEDTEEWIMTKFQINPSLKPEKFQKK